MHSRIKTLQTWLSRTGILLLVGWTSASCTLRSLAVNNFEWIATRVAASYLDLGTEQKKVFRRELRQFARGAGETHLASLATALRRIPGLDDPAEAFNATTVISRQILEQACDSFAPLLSGLTPDQRRYLKDKLRESNEEYDPDENGGWNELRESQQAKQLKTMKRWLGKLTRDQERIIVEGPGGSPEWNDSDGRREKLYLAYRIESQSSFQEILEKNQNNPQQMAADCRAITGRPELFLTEESRYFVNLRRQSRESILKALAPTLTKQQKSHLSLEIEELLADINKVLENANGDPDA